MSAVMLTACVTNHSASSRERNGSGFSIPTGVKKGRRLIHPSILFNEAMREYRVSRKSFPATLQQFEYSGDKARKAVKDMRESGFLSLEIGYSLLDSMEIFFIHKPVYTQRVGKTDLSVDARGVFIYTAKDSSVMSITKLERGLFVR
ncbi:hypothetical protein DF182_03850 [Chitinophaga flava]|uniref:Uncharacterized protein n=1 Tax=Chitinophaga flava TaxID=2259036 RepID=A0A365XZS2_9BACT|nr:hypothetical protein DF182_03850 [Chitinophaga flava]